jgi:hypothetical protein
MSTPRGLDEIFDQLDEWRHFPAYQLERRADIFFALYLSEVVGEHLGIELDHRVIPEFPLRQETSNRSDKADYLLLAKDKSRAFLVELKTDTSSRNSEQDIYLRAARERGLRSNFVRLIEIAEAASGAARAKYFHLLSALEEMGVLRLPEALRACVYAQPPVGYSKLIQKIEVTIDDAPLDIVYVQPRAAEGEVCIGLTEFAQVVARHPDPMSQRFAQSLRGWAERVAGDGNLPTHAVQRPDCG